MKTSTIALLLALVSATPVATGAGAAEQAATAAAEQDIAGAYFLTGVMETGGQLILQPGGRFKFGITYGAVDQMGSGTWVLKGDSVELNTDELPAPSFTQSEQLEALDLPRDDDGKPPPPVLLIVKVVSPKLRLVWSNMTITAEFSNGRSRSGTTGRGGTLGFLAKTDEDWSGAVIRRVSVAYPKAEVAPMWFDVDASRTKTLLVHFEPGSIYAPPFEQLVLKVERKGEGLVQLVAGGDEGRRLVFQKSR